MSRGREGKPRAARKTASVRCVSAMGSKTTGGGGGGWGEKNSRGGESLFKRLCLTGNPHEAVTEG